MTETVTCDYCGNDALLVTGAVVWPHRKDLADKQVWRCEPCDAHVGCHPGTTNPLGRLANMELRNAKVLAHAHFDPIWKGDKRKGRARRAAYAWLAEQLGIEPEQCHIGMFDVEMCMRVVAVCAATRSDARD